MREERSDSPSAFPPGLEATRSTLPSNELLGYSHASLRDVPRLNLVCWFPIFGNPVPKAAHEREST